MNPASLHSQAGEIFSSLVAKIKPDQWQSPTPCTDWDVRQLVNHLTAEHLWIPPLIEGKTIPQVGGVFDGDVLGAEPKISWQKAFEEARSAFSSPKAMVDLVHLSFGDVEGAKYAEQMFIDTLVHSWDLARGIGADDKLDPELIKACYDLLAPQAEDWRSSGAFSVAISVGADNSDQDKLLALTGRRS